ncbi:hypothetical protein TYRP_020216 [Tyrophagus putrescentiae]|nr:hypothetical protein TYRP_020216 [Tyrophagus putrescentiae]
MSQAKERAIEVVNTSMADVKHSDDLATAYGNDFLIMGGWKMAKEKPKDPDASFLSPVIPFPTFLDSFFSGYAQSFKEFISNATEDSTAVTDADLKKMDFFVRLAWRANTELGYSCQTQYKDEYWKFVLVMLVNDESGKPHPANDTVGTYKSNVKQFWT